MKLLNKQEKNNELLSRKQYTIEIEFEGAVPTKKETKKELCKELKADEELSVVRSIYNGFRSNNAKVEMFVYSKKEEMDRIENYLMHKKIKEKMKKAEESAKQGEEEKAEQKKEEPAKDEKKEGEE